MNTYLAVIGTIIAIEFLVFFIAIGCDAFAANRSNTSKNYDFKETERILNGIDTPDHVKLISTLTDKN